MEKKELNRVSCSVQTTVARACAPMCEREGEGVRMFGGENVIVFVINENYMSQNKISMVEVRIKTKQK